MGKVSRALEKMGPTKKDASTKSSIAKKAPSEPHRAKTGTSDYADESQVLTAARASINNWDERLGYAIEKFTGVTENFRRVRNKILHMDSDKPIRRIMVSSSSAQEGKSFVCSNLGISFAQSLERHALMIDCDLRRPTLQKLFGLRHTKGLTDYLNGTDKISSLIQPTGLDKLSIIPSGPSPQNPGELLTSEKMSSLLDDLTERFNDRLIILDSPPFHAASESAVLSQHVDGVVLVVRWGKSGRENIKDMVDSIGRDKIIGIVFNAFEMNILDRKIQGLSYNEYYSESYY